LLQRTEDLESRIERGLTVTRCPGRRLELRRRRSNSLFACLRWWLL